MNLKIIYIYLLSFIDFGVLGKNVRVLGGTNASINEFKYLVSFRHLRRNIHFCAGSIISDRHILTAAHCFLRFHYSFDPIRIYSGVTNSQDTSGPVYTIEEVKNHRHFVGILTRTAVPPHDIAIVKTREVIEFNQRTQKIDLPSRDVFAGNMGLIAGWGLTSLPGFTSPVLQKSPLTVISKEDCQALVPIRIEDYHLCAYHGPGIGACAGDGGGPVVSNGELYGVIAFRFENNRGLPDVHTKVYYYLDFIRNYIGQ